MEMNGQRKHPRFLALTLIVLLAMISTALAQSVAATPQSGQSQSLNRGAWLRIDARELARLEREGHSPSEVFTALSLAEQTGVPLGKWLAARKRGQTWLQAIDQLAKGVQLVRKPLQPQKSRTLTPQEILDLMREGYSGADITKVSNILFNHGGDPRHLLRLNREGLAWADIERQQQKAWQESMSGPKDPYNFGLGQDGQGTHTEGGLSKKEVAAIMELGYTLAEILQADALAASLGIKFKPTARKTASVTLIDMVLKKYAALTPAERAQARSQVVPLTKEQIKAIARQTGRKETEIRPNQDKVVAVSFAGAETTPSGLTPAEVLALVASGVDLKELMTADAQANARGLNFRAILAQRKAGVSLAELIRTASRNTPASARRVTTPVKQPTEEELVAMYAAKAGKSKTEVATQRALGKTWREITGVPESELRQALELAASWGLTDRELILQALRKGLWVNDAYQAALLAPATKLTAQEILALRTKDNTWADVLRQLFPGRPIPPAPTTHPRQPKPPVRLPRGGGQ